MSVLIVEDDADLRLLMRTLIRTITTDVDEAEDGGVAIHRIAAKAYDLVILDLMLPRVNGFEVYEATQRQSPRPRVIVISGIARYFDKRFAEDVVTLQKPFTAEEFVDAVRRGEAG